MATSPYFYNIIPFTPHFDELSLYFTDEALAHTERIYEKLFLRMFSTHSKRMMLN